MQQRQLPILWPLLLALLFSGCASHSGSYQTPKLTLPTSWEQASDTEVLPDDEHWWRAFADPTLNQLVDEALIRNNDLAAAALLVQRAQLRADQAESDLLPSTAVRAGASLSRNLSSSDKEEIRNFSSSATVSYELDLWKKLAETANAAHWEMLATEEDRASAALVLTATTATLYWQIAYFNQRLATADASIAYAVQTLTLAEVRTKAGAATRLDVLEAQRTLANQKAARTTLLQQRMEARNALAILFDGPPRTLAISEPENLSHVAVPKVAAGLPASLLARRPDLRAAEARLQAALATSEATRASWYPAISLSGNLGVSSDALSRLVRNPIGVLAADLTLPFIQWRDMQRNIKISETEYQVAVVNFRQTLYTALSEVEDSLSARQHYLLQGEQLELVLATALQVEEIYRVRYQAGNVAIKAWLDAQENRRQAETALAENHLNLLLNYITLCKALGGNQ
ncbi:efflux transporter outer membrane subunit [Desulfobulbus alkaliphilus]|uniref:efflux transporter outer membrane subunit n=1 Tax=Desulfobulbus alkaliphilus TaxID=869814 RepID=UPI001965064B|nr:efflux transporter outer membrane subunit [Desulfobulbus alkaliphilus]MBM9537132.1 efflux transporter outer membrane subunit [Desulfobulbus alkaliphilus]